MRRRRRKRSAELTPLLDVLFILLFASLVQARERVERDLEDRAEHTAAPAPAPIDAGAPDAAPDAMPDAALDAGATSALADHGRRLSALIAGAVHGRDAFAVEVSETGHMVEIRHWRGGALIRRESLQHLLVTVPPEESSPELVYYRGDTQPGHRICPVVLAHVEPPRPDLARALVVITADTPLADLPLALRNGLVRDAALCFEDAAGVAVLLDPENPLPWSEIDEID